MYIYMYIYIYLFIYFYVQILHTGCVYSISFKPEKSPLVRALVLLLTRPSPWYLWCRSETSHFLGSVIQRWADTRGRSLVKKPWEKTWIELDVPFKIMKWAQFTNENGGSRHKTEGLRHKSKEITTEPEGFSNRKGRSLLWLTRSDHAKITQHARLMKHYI